MPAIVYEVIHDYGFEVPFIKLAQQLVNNIADRYATDSRNIAVLNLAESAPIRGKQAELNKIEYHKLETFLRRNRIDAVLMVSIIEPHWALNHEHIVEKIIKPLGVDYKCLGWYTQPGSTFFDLWSQVMTIIAPAYTEEELLPIESNKFFLCHTGNPMPHRIDLFDKIVDNGLDKFGFINLSKVASSSPKYIQENLTQNYATQGDIPHDPYTLGDLSIWKQTIFTVVSDAFFFESGSALTQTAKGLSVLESPGKYGHTIISEKIYKPIIGLRPFLVNGSYEVTKKFKDLGFDLFEDVLDFTLDDLKTKQSTHELIIRTLKMLSAFTNEERLQWYNELLPRLRLNKQQLYIHAHQQKELLTQFQI